MGIITPVLDWPSPDTSSFRMLYKHQTRLMDFWYTVNKKDCDSMALIWTDNHRVKYVCQLMKAESSALCWKEHCAASSLWAWMTKALTKESNLAMLVPWCHHWRLWWGRCCSNQKVCPDLSVWYSQQCPGERNPPPDWHCKNLNEKYTRFSTSKHFCLIADIIQSYSLYVTAVLKDEVSSIFKSVSPEAYLYLVLQ